MSSGKGGAGLGHAAKTKVVHCRRETYDIYIGRPSKWGNKFVIGKDGDREEVIAKYREWLMRNKALLGAVKELQGKVLGCWCKPHACHGDVLVELAEEKSNELRE